MPDKQGEKRDAAAAAYLIVVTDNAKYPIDLGAPRSKHAQLFMYAAAHSSILSDLAKAAKDSHAADKESDKPDDWRNYGKYIGALITPEVESEIQTLIEKTKDVCPDVDIATFTSIADALDEASEEKDELAPMDGGGFGDLAKAAIAFVTSSCSRRPAEIGVVLDDATRKLVDARSREPKPPSAAKSWAWMAKTIASVLASSKIASALAGNTSLSGHLAAFFDYVAEVADPSVVARNLLESLGADVRTALSALHASTNVMICLCLIIIFYDAVVSGGSVVGAIIRQMQQFVKTLRSSGAIDAAKEQFLDLQLLMYLNGVNPELLSGGPASEPAGASGFLMNAAAPAAAAPAPAPSLLLPSSFSSALAPAPAPVPEEVVGPMDRFVSKTRGRASSVSGKGREGGHRCTKCGSTDIIVERMFGDENKPKRKTRRAAPKTAHKKSKKSKTSKKGGSYRKNRKLSRRH